VRALTEFKRLEDVCDLFADGDWIETKDQSPNGIRLIQTGNIGNGEFKVRGERARFISESTFRRLRCTEIYEGDCLISRLPDPVGRSCLLPATGERMITAVDCTIIRFRRDLIEPKYFHYFAQSQKYFAQVEKLTSGATRRRISRSNLGNIVLPRPPLSEQQRIITILDEVFAGLATATANAEKNLKNASELFESYLNSVFARRQEGWVEKAVGDIADHCLGKMLDKKRNRGDLQPYLRNLNVRWFDFDRSDMVEMRFEPDELDRFSAKKGDLLICEGGYPGRAAIWQDEEPVFFQKAIHRVRCSIPGLNKWVLYFLYSEDAGGNLQRHFTGSGIQHFTGQALARFRIPIPPVAEMQRHVRGFDALRAQTAALRAVSDAKLRALVELKQSILQKAFAGELTSAPMHIIQQAAE
jgi:type I restriction enzyme, S subunit